MNVVAVGVLCLLVGVVAGAMIDELITVAMLKENAVAGYDCHAKPVVRPMLQQVP